MDFFTEALLSEKTEKIPEAYDWFAPLIGDWDCDYYDEPEAGQKRHVKGEWIFRRILEGAGIQDVFIFPSRNTRRPIRSPTENTARPCGYSTGKRAGMMWYIPATDA